MKLEGRRKNLTILLFSAVYLVSYLTRINFGAIISEMEAALTISKKLLSLSLTGSFITYGIGQTIVGILGEKIHPKWLIATGFSVTSIINFTLPFCYSPYAMAVLWSINGFSQAFMWPPLVKYMVELFTSDDYKNTTLYVSCGSSIGTILIYLTSPLIITLGSWKSVFFTSAACGVLMLSVWLVFAPKLRFTRHDPIPVQEKTADASFFSPSFLVVMLAIMCMGILRDGVTTWMPSYISETYETDNLGAILSGVILPVFAMICYKLTQILYKRKFKNPLACTALIYSFASLTALVLLISSGKNSAVSLLSMAILTAAMHGVSLMLTTMILPFFKKYGRISTVSGILNSATYVGSALSTYGVALLAEEYSWQSVLAVWLAVAITGTLLCALIIRPWKRIISE